MEGNEVNGYPVLCTSAVAGKGIVYGNFADLVIGQWGGINQLNQCHIEVILYAA